jgi:hypothetical protein
LRAQAAHGEFGMSGGKPIWIHNDYPWLHSLADQAIEEGKKKP